MTAPRTSISRVFRSDAPRKSGTTLGLSARHRFQLRTPRSKMANCLWLAMEYTRSSAGLVELRTKRRQSWPSNVLNFDSGHEQMLDRNSLDFLSISNSTVQDVPPDSVTRRTAPRRRLIVPDRKSTRLNSSH